MHLLSYMPLPLLPQVVVLPGSSLCWQQTWEQEVQRLHSRLYPAQVS
jgi:hypothetical protein